MMDKTKRTIQKMFLIAYIQILKEWKRRLSKLGRKSAKMKGSKRTPVNRRSATESEVTITLEIRDRRMRACTVRYG